MKIELVDENRIKVVLSCYDILELNFDVSSLSTDTAETKLIFKNILKKAEEQIGFYANVDKILAEAVPSAKDGYVIYITKIAEKEKANNATVFSFIDFSTLKTAVKAYVDGFRGNTDLFVLDNKYYLVFNGVSNETLKKTEIMLTEFGEKIINPVMFVSILNEYGKLLYKKNAIKMIKNQKN